MLPLERCPIYSLKEKYLGQGHTSMSETVVSGVHHIQWWHFVTHLFLHYDSVQVLDLCNVTFILSRVLDLCTSQLKKMYLLQPLDKYTAILT